MDEELRRVPAVGAARARESVAGGVVLGGLFVVPAALVVGIRGFRSNPPAGSSADGVETAVLLTAVLGPFLLAIGCAWWGRLARARRTAEDAVLADWPAEPAARYRYTRRLATLKSRTLATMLLGITLMVIGVIAQTLRLTGLRAPLGLHVLSRLGLYPSLVGTLLLFGGLLSLGFLGLLSLVVAFSAGRR